MIVNAFLPARAGSVRIPHKNTQSFLGFQYGLIEIKLQQLLKSKRIHRIFVSSDDDEILSYARELKSSKIILHKRDSTLCSSETTTDSLITHAYQLIGGENILWTHCTSPFFATYDKAIEAYEIGLNEGYDSLMSVTKHLGFFWDKEKPLNYKREPIKWVRTQDANPIYEVNNAVFLAHSEVYKNAHDRIGSRVLFYPTSKIEGLDIDYPEDFDLAQSLLKSNLSLINGGGGL